MALLRTFQCPWGGPRRIADATKHQVTVWKDGSFQSQTPFVEPARRTHTHTQQEPPTTNNKAPNMFRKASPKLEGQVKRQRKQRYKDNRAFVA